MQLLTGEQAAKALGIVPGTLTYHHKFRNLPEPLRVGRRLLYSAEDMQQLHEYFKCWKERDRPTMKNRKGTK